ncbi:hypothetical protein Ppb6_01218 [Photorhabdus australis subsp. thailandensis]|uniref:Uncharacterized protein n=1 Tax=Photorhabdus australis subsp. thailandensis TaxID=2805096 RepID=A0A1C0U6M6_9GAMM|nr:hypothetical protein [Photorhabdus australis]OCQ53592.1 hypothetical protein Ppb6_01218 [Photorhabdus australis subsp. thailandensis]
MNLLEYTVEVVLSEPKKHEFSLGSYWSVDVEYNCHGSLYKTQLTFKTREEAEKVKIGYMWVG